MLQNRLAVPLSFANMKFLLPFLVAITVCTAGVIENRVENPSSDYKEEDRFFYFPGDDGKLYLVDSAQPADEHFIKEYDNKNNAYLLYTSKNPLEPQFLSLGNEETVTGSNFDPSKETVFYAHGWNGDGYSATCRIITDAFLQSHDVNVIVLDWSSIAVKDYVTAKSGVPLAGRGLGEFINWLITLGLQYENVHLVGFNLGAHLVGNAGRATSGKVQRITALDPAGRLWSHDNNRLARTDAKYVEVIHTNTILYGFSEPLGHADFYPNGGGSMAGCSTNTCSHARAVRYMASSVKYNHLTGNKCTFLAATSATGALCRGDENTYPMGNNDLSKIWNLQSQHKIKLPILILAV